MIVLSAFVEWLCQRLCASPPEPVTERERAVIADTYREHDHNIVRNRQAIKKVEFVEQAIKRRQATGNWVGDMISGTYTPERTDDR